MKLLEQIPPGRILHFGPHNRKLGFHAEILNIGSNSPSDWFKCSHGHTPEEAIENALARMNDELETHLYHPKDFQ